jgi:hypothetical protein
VIGGEPPEPTVIDHASAELLTFKRKDTHDHHRHRRHSRRTASKEDVQRDVGKELGVPNEHFEAFGRGTQTLTPQVLCALAKYLFGGHAQYDPNLDRLRPAAKQESTPLGIRPPPLDVSKLPKFTGGPPPAQLGYGSKPQPKASRPGWVE